MAFALDPYEELRDALRSLCAHYPDGYWRKVDEKRGIPRSLSMH